jgi:WD40 repeat protein/serine/threonine protein kinase
MGIVLRAFDEKLHRVVAIKALTPALAEAGAARQRFVREARAAAAVTHDHVIAIHAVEDSGPVPYFVMQFIEGCTLQEKLDRVGALPLKEILRLGIQLADGLTAAHRVGLVHRDVKPANILLENGIERVRLTDFGLARAADDASLTQSGVITGTPSYMSPEQANGEKIDHRSDLFSLGSILYALCTGHPPFRAGTPMAVLKRVCEETPRSIREINPEIPQWLEAAISKLQAKEPEQRFATASEVVVLLREHLARLQEGLDVVDARSAAANAADRPAERGRRSFSAGRLAIAMLVVPAVLAAGWLSRDRWLPGPSPRSSDSAPVPSGTWTPRPPVTADLLAKLPDPLDDLKREAIPATLLSSVVDGQGTPMPELVGLIGGGALRLPQREQTHWPTQSPDGRLLALPCGKTVVLYDTSNGAIVRILKGHAERTFMGDFTPDGKRFACGAVGGVVKIWDVTTGNEELSFKDASNDTNNDVWVMVFSRDGTRIVTGGVQGNVKVWDATSGRELKTLGRHEGGAACLAFNSDGTRLASAGLDCVVRVWDWSKGELLRTLEPHPDMIQSIAFSPDGSLLASGSHQRVMVWDVAKLERRHSLETGGSGLLAFTADGQTLLTAVHAVQGGQNRTIMRWDIKTGERSGTLDLPGPPGVVVWRLSRDGRTVYAMGYVPPEARLGAYDAVTGAERFSNQGHSKPIRSVAFSPSGRMLATGGGDGRICFWDLEPRSGGASLSPVRVSGRHNGQVWTVAFSLDGQVLGSIGTDGARLWDAATGSVVQELASGPSGTPTSLAFSPDGESVAAGSENGSVNFWAVKTGQPKEPVRWHVGPVGAVAFSSDGRWLASAGNDQTVQLIDRATGQRSHTFRTGVLVTHLAFSPDSQSLAAGSDSSAAPVRLWNVATKTEQTLTGHTQGVTALAFHPAGGRLATASLDGTLRVSDLMGKGEPGPVFDFHHMGPCAGVAFAPSGRHLAVGLGDGSIAILRTPPRTGPR